MQETKFNKMHPHIEIKPFPINSRMDDFEDDTETLSLFHVTVSQGVLKMLFLVVLQDQLKHPGRVYDTIRCEYVSLHGLDERDKYLGVVDNIAISADCTIVNEIFDWSLKPYGLKLLSANFHDFEFFESDVEGKGFVFEDSSIHNTLKDLIDSKCKLMMRNQNVIQY